MDPTLYFYKTVVFFVVLSLVYQCGYVNGLVDDDDDPKKSKLSVTGGVLRYCGVSLF